MKRHHRNGEPCRLLLLISTAVTYGLVMMIDECNALPLDQFFPFGLRYAIHDDYLSRENDCCRSLGLQNGLRISDTTYNRVFVNSNGIVSLGQDQDRNCIPLSANPLPFPLNNGFPIIAPFWTRRADTGSNDCGNVWLHLIHRNSDRYNINRLQDIVSSVYHREISIVEVVIITWEGLKLSSDQRNTFQCILLSDGHHTFVLFLYADEGSCIGCNGVETSGSDPCEGFWGIPAQVGYDIGNGRNYEMVMDPFTSRHTVCIVKRSNVNVPGVFVFQLLPTPEYRKELPLEMIHPPHQLFYDDEEHEHDERSTEVYREIVSDDRLPFGTFVPYKPTKPNYDSSEPNYRVYREIVSDDRLPSGTFVPYKPTKPNYDSSEPNYRVYREIVSDDRLPSGTFVPYKPTKPNYESSEPNYESSEPNYESSKPNYESSEPNYESSEPNYKSSKPCKGPLSVPCERLCRRPCEPFHPYDVSRMPSEQYEESDTSDDSIVTHGPSHRTTSEPPLPRIPSLKPSQTYKPWTIVSNYVEAHKGPRTASPMPSETHIPYEIPHNLVEGHEGDGIEVTSTVSSIIPLKPLETFIPLEPYKPSEPDINRVEGHKGGPGSTTVSPAPPLPSEPLYQSPSVQRGINSIEGHEGGPGPGISEPPTQSTSLEPSKPQIEPPYEQKPNDTNIPPDGNGTVPAASANPSRLPHDTTNGSSPRTSNEHILQPPSPPQGHSEIEKCPIIGSQACKDRILRLTCQYLARVKGIDKLPLPCQRILQDMNKPPSVLLEL